MPWAFTRHNFFGFSFDKTGPIGDTIGGITAPFVGLLAAFLVYKSFMAQLEANKILSKETTYNYINGLLINTLTYITDNKYGHEVDNFLSQFGVYFSEAILKAMY